jgi:hypothetical protein
MLLLYNSGEASVRHGWDGQAKLVALWLSCRCMTFRNLWYSVDLPEAMAAPEHPRNMPDTKPRLYLLNVRRHQS